MKQVKSPKPHSIVLGRGQRCRIGSRVFEVKANSYPVTLLVQDEFAVDTRAKSGDNAGELQ